MSTMSLHRYANFLFFFFTRGILSFITQLVRPHSLFLCHLLIRHIMLFESDNGEQWEFSSPLGIIATCLLDSHKDELELEGTWIRQRGGGGGYGRS